MSQQRVLDSLGKMYAGHQVIINTFNDFNGEPKKILLYNSSGFKVLDTLKPGSSVLLIKELQQYSISPNSIVKVLVGANTMVKTHKGDTGMIRYYFVQPFKEELKRQALETDTM